MSVDITPDGAGWTYCGLRVVDLAPGASLPVATGAQETLVLPLSGGCVVTCDDESVTLTGRPDVFAGPTDFAYLPISSTATISTAGGGRFALPSARATRRLPFRYGPVSGVPVELRGAGRASRQVDNFCTPETFDADKLIAVEVLTPSGNWSSYPPHKHDEHTDTSGRWRRSTTSRSPARTASATSGSTRPARTSTCCARCASGDVVLIPHGYHGPSMAPPGYDMYYLNVMAGPDPERAWLFSDDPAHAWIRTTWADEDVDPRLPFGRR